MLSDILMNPKFDLEEIEKERKVILEEEKMYHDDPRLHTLDKCVEFLYEKNHKKVVEVAICI